MTLPTLRLSLLRPAHLIRWALALCAVLLTLWGEWSATSGQGLLAEERLRDRLVRLHLSDAEEKRILVVDIDEASLARVGAWPWPSERVAELVELLLTRYDARGVALDIVLPKPASGPGDARLAALAAHGPVVLAQAFDYSTTRPEPLREGVPGGAYAAPRAAALPATGFLANHAALARAPHIGNIGFVPDPDGTLRRLPLVTAFEGRHYPALALSLLECCAGIGPLAVEDGAAARVAYRRDWRAYTVVSAADILDGSLSPEGASGRLVLLGSSSLGLSDRVTTPLAVNRPGLGVQADMLTTLLDRQQGRSASAWPGALIAVAYASALTWLAMLAFARVSAARSALLLGAGAAVWLGLAYLIHPHDGSYSPTAPLATILFLLTFAVPFHWQLTQHKSRHLLDTLRQYVAPAVVEQLMRSDLADPLAPRQLDITTLIADMEGYTTQVESLSVEDAARLTSDFLACLTGPVIEHLGTLDKYTGDGLVAFWGAPVPNPEHADLALSAAREIVQRVAVLSGERARAGMPALRVRIGIDSGLAMAGNFGTSFRSIYTAVGDSVNTASRLEQAARDYPHDIIVGAGTAERVRRHVLISLGERLLRGKGRPTPIYTLANQEAAT